jgi:hypothetical protein
MFTIISDRFAEKKTCLYTENMLNISSCHPTFTIFMTLGNEKQKSVGSQHISNDFLQPVIIIEHEN